MTLCYEKLGFEIEFMCFENNVKVQMMAEK